MAGSTGYTQEISSGQSLVISSANSFSQISVVALSGGTCRITGSGRMGSTDSTPINIPAGIPFTIGGQNASLPLNGWTIEAVDAAVLFVGVQ